MEKSLHMRLVVHFLADSDDSVEPICYYDGKIVSTANETAVPAVAAGMLSALYAAAEKVKEVGGV